MKAIVFHAPFDVRLEEVPTPEPAEGEALVRIRKVGICGGDYHYYDGTNPYAHYPHIYGHEMVGRVARVRGESALRPGDLVTGEIIRPCGHCFACRHRKPNCCANMNVVGAQAPGVYAEYAVYPLDKLHAVPEPLDEEDGVLVEPYSIGHHIAHRAPVLPGESALVIGCGTIGLTAIDVLKARGARVIAADLVDARLRTARDFGADACIHSGRENLEARALELTGGEGAALVCEATGSTAVMARTLACAASGGSVVLAGIVGAPVTFDSLPITRKELTIYGSRNACGDFEKVIELMRAGRLHQRKLITRRVPMAEAPEAFRALYADRSRDIKVVLEWP